MAKVVFGGGITSITGKIGGWIFQNSIGGPTVRAGTMPVISNSTTQTTSRGKFASIANAWTADLTDAQRTAWAAFAVSNGTTTSVSTKPRVLGRMLFNRLNRAIIDAGGTPVLDPPTYQPLPGLINPVLLVDSIAGTIQLQFDNDPITFPFVLSIRATQPYLSSNIYKSNACNFVQNFQPATSPVDFTAEWTKLFGAWQLIPGCVIYSEPYIVHQQTGSVSPPIKISGVVT